MPDCCTNPNPDITGVGVRSALYAQVLLGWVVALIWPREYEKCSGTAYMTAIALIIAAFIQLETQQGQLNLVDGIVVSLITTMMITYILSSSASSLHKIDLKPEGNGAPDPRYAPNFWTQFTFVTFWAAWCINLWKNPYQFGVSLGCANYNPNVMIVLFGHKVHVTSRSMQIAALVLVCIGTLIAFLSLRIGLLDVGRWVNGTWRYITGESRPDQQPDKEPKLVRCTRVFLQAIAFGTLIFLIVTTEQTINENDREHSTTDWTYGQTIALVLLLQQIMDLCSTVLEKRSEAREHLKEIIAKRRSVGDDAAKQGDTADPTATVNQLPAIAPAPPASK